MVETQIIASSFQITQVTEAPKLPDVRMDRLDVFNETTGESWQVYAGTDWTGQTPKIKANARVKIRITYSNYGGAVGVRFDVQVTGLQSGTVGQRIITDVDHLSGPIQGAYRDHWINMWSENIGLAWWLIAIT
jgi:hypothetical protein